MINICGHNITEDQLGKLIEKSLRLVMDERWITVHPNGEEHEGRHLKLEDGESPKQAMKRQWGVDLDKKKEDKVEIKRETQKAYLLKKGDKEFWIQKRWMREDGTLTPAGQQAYEKAETITEKEARFNAKKEYERRLKEGGYPIGSLGKPDYESEKAYGFDLNLDFYDAERNKRVRVFIPKSVIKNNSIPKWIVDKKVSEALSIYDNYSKYGGYFVEYNPFKAYEDELKKKYGAE